MSVNREIDWAMWLNKLVFCYGCGRFAMPVKGKPPRGWKMLYQPHPEGRPGLNVCSAKCGERVCEAMTKGPVTEPLEMRPPPLPVELQQEMSQAVRQVVQEEKVVEYERPWRGTFGELIREARLRAGKTLDDIEQGLVDEGFTRAMLAAVERGRRPVTWDQMGILCGFLDVEDQLPFERALVEYHHALWEDRPSRVTVVGQSLEARVVPTDDPVELVEALKSTVAAMDVGHGALVRIQQMLREQGAVNESLMAGRAAVLLSATRGLAQGVLGEAFEEPEGED
jgi:transcriptional regulator with XRE-family HTH domain